MANCSVVNIEMKQLKKFETNFSSKKILANTS